MDDYDNISHDSDSVPFSEEKSINNDEKTRGGTFVLRAQPRLFSESRKIVAEYQKDDRPIRVDPGEIRFESIEPGVLYVMSFAVRNATKSAHRIRIRAPKSGFFALNYIPAGVIAPGIEIRAEIECQLPAGGTENRFLDSITIAMGQHTLDIPLHATKPSALINYNPLCNLGYVAEGQPVSVTVPLENKGHLASAVAFSLPENTKIKIHPLKLDLPPGGKGSITVSFEGKDLGPWREFVKIHSTNTMEPGLLDVTVQVVDQKLSLLAANNGGILENVDFGALFYGQSKIVDALLVNTGPQQLSFAVSYDDSSPQPEDGAAPLIPPLEKLMVISPSQGVIKPFSQVPVKIKFNPQLPSPLKGFASRFVQEAQEIKFATRRAMIDCSEVGQRLNLNMSGNASSPSVAVTPTMLRFGACSVNDRRDILISVTNRGPSRTSFSFSHPTHFKVSIEKGELQPYQALSVVVSFTPTQLGTFKNIIKLALADGLSCIDMKVVAEADQLGKKILVGGLDAAPEDFQKSLKFVDPEEIRATRRSKKEGKKTLSGTATVPFHPLQDDNTFFSNSSSKLRDEIYGLETSIDQLEVGSANPFRSKQEHNQTYNQYLQQSHKFRQESKKQAAHQRLVARGASDRNDPFGVDMGMERGLDEPMLKLPSAGEPLWLRNSGDGSGGSKSRIPSDEHRLIQKKWPSAPSTQAEAKDCAAEIGLEELSLIVASHKTIDFGNVCIGSQSWRNFCITNDLSQSILVKIDDFEPESKASKPDVQIVPAGAEAGFDIAFKSKILGKYKKTFTYKINGHYAFKVSIVAEVVPIALEMSKSELLMEFPDESIEPSLSHDLMLKNPGNAIAEYFWVSNGAFVCRPDRGSIHPGQAAITTIIWTPAAEKRNKEELELNVTGGVVKTLVVSGMIKEAKAAFLEKKLSFGTVAVGVQTKLKASIVNTGSNAAVYFVDPSEDKLGISVIPEKGIIPPGETVKLEVIVLPKTAMNYENAQISVKVRGNKSTALKIHCESLLPTFEMKEKSFPMGIVAVGSEFRSPFTITNKATIPASLTLDLSSYPDFKPCISVPKDYGEITAVQYDSSHNSITLVQPVEDGSQSPASLKRLNLWKIKITPGGTMRGSLVFAPTAPKKYNFKLPLSLQGLESSKTFAVEVVGEAIPSKLAISSQVVDFGNRFVSRDPLARGSYFLEVAFRSLDASKGFSYEIKDAPDENDHIASSSVEEGALPVFFISPAHGDLAPNTILPIRVTFQPPTKGNFSKRLNIYITGQPDPDRPYYSLLCKGSGVYPRMTFSKDAVQLPAVPLGTTSRAALTIFNNGYSSLKIKHKVSPAITVPLDISFPDGDELSITNDSVKVVISARSDTPCSWGGKIEFLDNDAERFVVYVSGCSDNSLMTNSSFIRDYGDAYGFLGLASQPVLFIRKTDMLGLRAQDERRKEILRKQKLVERQGKGGGSISSVDSNKKKKTVSEPVVEDILPVQVEEVIEGVDPDKVNDSRSEIAFDHNEAALVMKWLNRNICRVPFDEERFPHCITDTYGDVAVDCIEQLSGRKIAGIRPGIESDDAPGTGMPGSRRGERADTPNMSPTLMKLNIVNRIVAKYQAIINFLVKSGALLSHVNPVNLLNLEDHLLAQEQELKKLEGNRFTANFLATCTKAWTASWLIGCQTGWMDIIFQSIKVFTLSRVTFASFSVMPGVLLPPPEEPMQPADGKGKKSLSKGPVVPVEFTKSNVYSQAESVLLAWISYHVGKAVELSGGGARAAVENEGEEESNPRIIDFFGDLSNLFPLLQVMHSHLPESTKYGRPLHGYTDTEKTKRDELCSRLIDSLEKARMLFDFTEEEIVCSGRTLLLLALHLFLNLPSLLPKSRIEFKGTLGSLITKTIELKNPSKKKVVYSVTLQGSSDFSIASKELVLLPGSSADFQVSCKARFFEPVTSMITFWGVREDGVAGSTMVFQLVSNMVSRKPEFSITKKLSVYEMDAIQLTIPSPFSRECLVPVRMLHHFAPLPVDEALKGNPVNPKLKGVPTGSALANEVAPGSRDTKLVVDEDKEMEAIFKNPFWATEDSVQFAPGGTKMLVVNALPFLMGIHTCHIIFMEPSMGEYCYELVLDVGLPKPSEKLDFAAVKDGSTCQKKLTLSSKNVMFDKALSNVVDVRLTNPSKKGKARSVLTSLMASTVDGDSNGASSFIMSILSPFFACAKEFAVVSEYKGAAMTPASPNRPDTQGGKSKKVMKTSLEAVTPQDIVAPGLNSSIISFNPDRAGTYTAQVAVYSKSNKNDLRMLELGVMVTMPNLKLVLEFRGPARQKLSQAIPILNESSVDWNLQANVTGRGFAGPKGCAVPRGENATFPLTFTAPYAGSFEGTLTLTNSGEHHDNFEYALVGVAEDPLAEEHLQFKCKARTRQLLSIPLKSIPRPAGGGQPKVGPNGQPAPQAANPVFQVQTDLPYVTGPSEIEIGSNGSVYEFSILCPVGGVISGSISFTDSTGGALLWYTVDVEVTAPLPESTIEVSSMVRKAAAVEISLENPTKELLVFTVTTEGDGLLGDSTYSLPSSSNNNNAAAPFYELIYSPLLEGKFVGKISFYNQRVGEFWYKLHLQAIPAPPTVVDVVECMVGGTKIVSIPIENPLADEVALTVTTSDPEHFFVPSDQVVLGPYAQSSFPLHFRPSSLTELAYSEVILSHPAFGTMQCNVTGRGLLPGVMPSAQVFAPLNEVGSHTISFRNPFPHPLPIEIVLDEDLAAGGDGSSGFSILLRKCDVVIPARTPMQISIGFSPTRLGEYSATVSVRSNIGGRSLLWCYPVLGMAEAGSPQVLDPIETPCKTSLLRDVEVYLKGLCLSDLAPGDTISASEFSLELIAEDKNKALIARSFRVQALELVTLPELDVANRTDFVMRYRLLFEPLKTYTATVEMLIESKNRGRWRVQAELESTDPMPDDIIALTAAVGGSDKVAFKLSNRFLGFSSFQAYFTAKSSSHFSVTPTSGVLAPYGSDGTTFVVSFSPSSYGLRET